LAGFERPVEIELIIRSNNLSKMNKTRNSIDFDFTATSYYVTALTNFGNTGRQIFTELKNLSDALIPGKNSIEVNYRVFCPASINLSIINKFGDIYIDHLRGEVNISLANGDMKINSISGETQIDLSFGNGIINYLSDATISSSYSDINIKQSVKLKLNSKSSTLNIGEVDFLVVDSRRDKYIIDRLHTVRGSTNFTRFWLEELACEFNLDMKLLFCIVFLGEGKG
jgi:hypothetical protein